jgi:hypothetical protein
MRGFLDRSRDIQHAQPNVCGVAKWPRTRGRTGGAGRREAPYKRRLESAIRGKLSFQIRNFLQNPCQFDVNVRHFVGHFVMPPFVFIHIPGSTFIFNIFWRWWCPMSDFLFVLGVAESPQRADVGAFPARHGQCLSSPGTDFAIEYTHTSRLCQEQSEGGRHRPVM